jgi:hypothetical protein
MASEEKNQKSRSHLDFVGLATRAGRSHLAAMVKILISPAAFDAIATTLPLGTVAVEPERAKDGSVGALCGTTRAEPRC